MTTYGVNPMYLILKEQINGKKYERSGPIPLNFKPLFHAVFRSECKISSLKVLPSFPQIGKLPIVEVVRFLMYNLMSEQQAFSLISQRFVSHSG